MPPIMLLRSVEYASADQITQPLCVSRGLRNILGPRYGHVFSEIDDDLINFLCTVDSFRYVNHLSLGVSSRSKVPEILLKVAERCEFLESLKLRVHFSMKPLSKEGFEHLASFGRLRDLTLVASRGVEVASISQVFPPFLSTLQIEGSAFSNYENPVSAIGALPRQLRAFMFQHNRMVFGRSTSSSEIAAWFPPRLVKLDLSGCDMMGAEPYSSSSKLDAGPGVDCSIFPQTLQILYLNSSSIVALRNFKQLPIDLQKLELSQNQLRSGSIDFAALPPRLRSFRVKESHLSGEISLHNLPAGLEVLDISFNQLSFAKANDGDGDGRNPLSNLPPTLRQLILEYNDFSCELTPEVVRRFPPHLEVLQLSKNSFAGELSQFLPLLPKFLRVLDVSHNAMKGGFRIEDCPKLVRSVCVEGNMHVMCSKEREHYAAASRRVVEGTLRFIDMMPLDRCNIWI